MTWRSFFGVVTAVSALSIGCGGGRTSAATQKSPAFDPAQSDAKAIAAVDAMVTAMGGQAAWDKVKQISWEAKYVFKGEVKAYFRHAWDKWNGRHRFERADMKTYKQAKSANDDKLLKWVVAMYDLFDHDRKGAAEYGGKPVSRANRDKIVKSAFTRWKDDHYKLAFPYKAKDPGVILKYIGERPEKDGKGVCKPKCTTIKVTFAKGIGQDTYYLNINSTTHMPEIVEKQSTKGRFGFLVSDWVTVAGMKFPGKLQNIGLKDEVFTISKVKVAEPDDFLFVPRTRY